MHQWTVLHMVSITSGNVEISWGGGGGGEAKQAARAEQQWLAKAFRPCMSVTIVGIVPLYLSNHAYGFCVIHIQ